MVQFALPKLAFKRSVLRLQIQIFAHKWLFSVLRMVLIFLDEQDYGHSKKKCATCIVLVKFYIPLPALPFSQGLDFKAIYSTVFEGRTEMFAFHFASQSEVYQHCILPCILMSLFHV